MGQPATFFFFFFFFFFFLKVKQLLPLQSMIRCPGQPNNTTWRFETWPQIGNHDSRR